MSRLVSNIMDELGMVPVGDIARICFNNTVSSAYLKGEIGQTISGWNIGKTSYTTIAEAERLKASIRPVTCRPLDGPGIYVVGYKSFVKIGISNNIRSRLKRLQNSKSSKQ